MNICGIGRDFEHAQVRNIDFTSSQALLDFDAVFIDAAAFIGTSSLHATNHRRDEISEYLAYGRTVVVFTAPVQLDNFLPVPGLSIKTSSGSRIDCRGADYLKVFWSSIREDMQYLAFFEKPPGQPFLFVAETDKPVATFIKKERGNLLLLPWLKIYHYPSERQHTSANFIAAFKKLNEHISTKKNSFSFPSWSIQYGWDTERKFRDNLFALQQQANELSKTIGNTSAQLEAEDKLKILFTAKGDILTDMVIEAVRKLGAKAESGEPGRDDIIIEFEGKHAVVEVKGKKSSAAEADAAQLEKWVAGFKEDKGTDPKGILLVNAYCETPLADRTDPPFPDQMLKYSTRREHCLMTTTQLLGLLLEARAHPEKRVDLVNSMFSTVGVYQQFSDWRAFLTAPAAGPAKT